VGVNMSYAPLRISLVALVLGAFSSTGALAHRPNKPTGHIGPLIPPFRTAQSDISGTWTPLVSDFPASHPDTALLLPNGIVIMHDACTSNWFILRPDSKGSYINGSWDPNPSTLPSGYAPLYFASVVTPYFGEVVMNGGEYNGQNCPAKETASGADYGPWYGIDTNWSTFSGPKKWSTIGDAPSVLLTNPQDIHPYMLGRSSPANSKSQEKWGWIDYAWEATGGDKADANSEEGWTLLQTGDVLAVDTNSGLGENSPSELYDQSSGKWSPAATAVNVLVDPVSHEIGPAVVLPDGHVFQSGANPCGTNTCQAHTGIYIPENNTWIAGPDFPHDSHFRWYDVADGPAALLPNGRVLVQTSPNYGNNYNSPSRFYEFDESKQSLTRVNEPMSAPGCASYEGRMLVLPTGQIIWSSDGYETCAADVEIYTPAGRPQGAWLPIISQAPTKISRGSSYDASGTLFMGLSQGAAYGDDAQMATNYPIIAITNKKTGDVCFAFSFYWYSYTNDWVDSTTSTQFAVPAGCETGASSMELIANGIASAPWPVTVQ
jgi:hypothetical protein